VFSRAASSEINQENIESVNVLKGAAASALYGSRAANGVIVIN
jgi:TonB-dependent SusC/RagA subfamily outer membrane receptor